MCCFLYRSSIWFKTLNLIFHSSVEVDWTPISIFSGKTIWSLRCLSLTMAISFKGVEPHALGLLEILLSLNFSRTTFCREMSYFINSNSFLALYALYAQYAQYAHSQAQPPLSVPLARIMKKSREALQPLTSVWGTMSWRDACVSFGHWIFVLKWENQSRKTKLFSRLKQQMIHYLWIYIFFLFVTPKLW